MNREWMESLEEYLHRVTWNTKTIIENKKYGLSARWLLAAVFAVVFIFAGMKESYQAKAKIQEGIASEIIRFHVIANSDLDYDQAVKMKVKDAVITALRPKMNTEGDITEARKEILANMNYIQQVAKQTLKENGFKYDVNVSLGKEQFPIKVYGDITLPAGLYEALCIRIGKAEGHNWWCIVFPTLCYVNETYSYVPDASKGKLKHVLTDEEYEEITKGKGIQVKVKFELWEYLKKYFE